ncbi:pseudouridine synthase [Geomonas subterranea]|uniref:Pseudouridine synthase n=1 Tax=Geomonas subterranea TaxID=2847989 RepID=A0ABX8LGK8_9BACT|nr:MULTISPECIES: pseudouridine synthase [Geomonas]QXE91160.1 pseudouridine synthase [Geomonas subterranea]QXM10753.1 pseudouridine synthase [Geomonas subterranea]
MSISQYPAKVTMPRLDEPYPTVFAFLVDRFPRIPREVWEARIAQGKVLGEDGSPVSIATPYAAQKRVFYFREMDEERVIPFPEEILFQNDELLVACKPHFLPVTPGGAYLDQSLLHRLRKRTGIHHLVPLHRIDRETAGLVLFSVNPETRGRYAGLFREGRIEKEYRAVGLGPVPDGRESWLVESRLVPGEPWFVMGTEPGEVNARSRIRLLEQREGRSLFSLSPLTGKTHQLRVHMSSLGMPILNDRLYPRLQPRQPDDFDRPLQLLARWLRFKDPVSGKWLEFKSDRELLW